MTHSVMYQPAVNLAELERREYARYLIARQRPVSDIVNTLIARYTIPEAEAWKLYHASLAGMVTEFNVLEPKDYLRQGLAFWESILRDPAQPLNVQMMAQREITHLLTERKPKKIKKHTATETEARIERDAREALAAMDTA